jgi:hypothetical protein
LLAIEEINANPNILPNTKLVSAVNSGIGFSGSSDASRALANNYFGGIIIIIFIIIIIIN